MKPSFEQLKELTEGNTPTCVSLTSNNASTTRSLMVYYYSNRVNANIWKYVTLTDSGKFVSRIKYYQGQGSPDLTSQYCLTEDDLIIYPQGEVYFPLIAIFSCFAIFLLIYNIFIKRLLP